MQGFIARIALLATVLIAASQASAEDCNQPAADLLEDRHSYFLLDSAPASTELHRQITQFADHLAGRWRGHSELSECTGHFSDPAATASSFEVDAEISLAHSGAIKLEAEKLRATDRVLKLDRLFFSPELNKYRQGRERGWRSYEITFISPTRMVFSEKYRVKNLRLATTPRAPNSANATRLIHEIKEISLHRDALSVGRSLYVNGHFVAREDWQLERS